jgi:hypothetical protein
MFHNVIFYLESFGYHTGGVMKWDVETGKMVSYFDQLQCCGYQVSNNRKLSCVFCCYYSLYNPLLYYSLIPSSYFLVDTHRK